MKTEKFDTYYSNIYILLKEQQQKYFRIYDDMM